MKKILAIICSALMAFSAAAVFTACGKNEEAGTVMNLSLNPAVEFILDVNGKVVSVNALNEEGNLIKPEEPNGYKFETLVLDMIHLLDSCLPFEVIRDKEFAPIKNKTGVDSVESARELLKQNGVEL